MAFWHRKKRPAAGAEPDLTRLPRHIGIIMDGNGRWAKNRGLPRTAGHKKGAAVFKDIANYCDELGVASVYFYAFSTENWKRPLEEVGAIMKLFAQYLIEGFDYKIGDVTVDEDKGTATAEVTITCKSMNQIVEDFATQYQEKVAALDSMPSDDELYKMAGQVMVDVTKAAKTKDTTVTFKYTANDDGEWSADDSVNSEMMDAMLS